MPSVVTSLAGIFDLLVVLSSPSGFCSSIPIEVGLKN